VSRVPWYLPTSPDRIGGSCDKPALRLPETPRPCSGCPAHDAVVLHALLAAAGPAAKAVSCGVVDNAMQAPTTKITACFLSTPRSASAIVSPQFRERTIGRWLFSSPAGGRK
jgi:hypothetical protein